MLARRHPTPGVVLLPPDSERLVRMLAERSAEAGTTVPVAVAGDVADAVDAAVGMTAPGGVVLFSPAAPTPAGEGGYGARSRQFVAAAGLGAQH
jgi:UDP-N-acetylmuramoylalanine-D-glutamate ligase